MNPTKQFAAVSGALCACICGAILIVHPRPILSIIEVSVELLAKLSATLVIGLLVVYFARARMTR